MNRPKRAYNLLSHMRQKFVEAGSWLQGALGGPWRLSRSPRMRDLTLGLHRHVENRMNASQAARVPALSGSGGRVNAELTWAQAEIPRPREFRAQPSGS